MSDIAERVGVSRATVSYVLNDRTTGITIREETRQKILAVAAEMGYRSNDLARAVVTGKNFVFGFFSHSPSSEVSSHILIGAQEEADKHGYLIKLLPAMRADYINPVKRCIEQRLAGVLVINSNPEALDHLHNEASRFKMPICLLDNCPPRPWGIHITSDGHQGIRLALEHLVGLGHRHIAFVSAQQDSPLAASRDESFRQLMTEFGLPLEPYQVVSADWQEEDIIDPAVRQLLLVSPQRPTALLCAGDKIAMVALRTARSLGFQLPAQLSVMGFSNFSMTRYSDPALTCIAQPFEEMGRVAIRNLLEAIQHDGVIDLEPRRIQLPNWLVKRASTAPPSR